MADVQIEVINTTENVVNVAVPGVQGPVGLTGSVTIAQAGTAAEPGIRFESDTNTGIYSPGADQLAVSTGGTGRLFVDASGNVGIGTSSPRGLVSISNNVSGTGVVDSSLHLGFSTLDYYGFRIVNSNEPASTGAGLLKFQRGNTASWLDALVINNSGNVGIGTSSPSSTLEVMAAPDTVGTTNGIQVNIANPGLTPTQINSTTIGIGVTGQAVNFAGDLHIRSFWGFSIDKGAGNLSSGASNSVNADSRTFAIRQYAGGTTWNTQFCVNGSGNVGIGTTSPTTLLDVNADTVRVRTARTPASATATGATGEICWDASYIYVAVGTNTWKRAALTSW